jgi:hypothetical protein
LVRTTDDKWGKRREIQARRVRRVVMVKMT